MTPPKLIPIKSLRELPLGVTVYNYGAMPLLVVQAKHAANKRGPVEVVYQLGVALIVPVKERK